MLETKGLILPEEINRKNQNNKLRIDPQVEIRLEKIFGEKEFEQKLNPVENKREIYWGKNLQQPDSQDEVLVNLGKVNFSGYLQEEQFQVEKARKNTVLKKSFKRADEDEVKNKEFVHFIVRNAVDDTEIGEAKIELDELIDPNLNDLAKEYCVCLNRSHILDKIIEDRVHKEGEKKREKIMKEIGGYSKFSGIIRFQTLFQPTKDTSLRFFQLRDTSVFKSPK